MSRPDMYSAWYPASQSHGYVTSPPSPPPPPPPSTPPPVLPRGHSFHHQPLHYPPIHQHMTPREHHHPHHHRGYHHQQSPHANPRSMYTPRKPGATSSGSATALATTFPPHASTSSPSTPSVSGYSSLSALSSEFMPMSPGEMSDFSFNHGSGSSMDSTEQIYAFRPALPPTPEELSDQILDKLEQAGRVPSKEKFRRMACNTFVFTGACPYNDRCVFLHDYRIKAEGVKVRTTRQTKANSAIKDTFYWPDMTRKEVIRNTDNQGLPTANQMYIVPDSFKNNPQNFHNRGLCSLWSHFVEFCVHNNALVQGQGRGGRPRDICSESFFMISGYRENPHVPGAQRLNVFIHLSLGKTLLTTKAQPSLLPPVPVAGGFSAGDIYSEGKKAAPVRRMSDWSVATQHANALYPWHADSDSEEPERDTFITDRDREKLRCATEDLFEASGFSSLSLPPTMTNAEPISSWFDEDLAKPGKGMSADLMFDKSWSSLKESSSKGVKSATDAAATKFEDMLLERDWSSQLTPLHSMQAHEHMFSLADNDVLATPLLHKGGGFADSVATQWILSLPVDENFLEPLQAEGQFDVDTPSALSRSSELDWLCSAEPGEMLEDFSTSADLPFRKLDKDEEDVQDGARVLFLDPSLCPSLNLDEELEPHVDEDELKRKVDFYFDKPSQWSDLNTWESSSAPIFNKERSLSPFAGGVDLSFWPDQPESQSNDVLGSFSFFKKDSKPLWG